MSKESIATLKKYVNSINVAHHLSDDKLLEIGQNVLYGYKEDLQSMQEWLSDVKLIEDFTSLKSVKKSTPLANSANVKLPIITKACLEYQSRTYPAIFKDKQVVKYTTIGHDGDYAKAKQGQKCIDYMNYQLLFASKEWEQEHYRLLFLVAMVGFICKKQYYDPIKNKIKSKICDYDKLIINANISSLEEAPRITEIVKLKLNDVVARKNKKVDGESVFLEQPCEELYNLHKLDQIVKEIEFIEQQVDLDLDEDGMSEPYIVTCLKDTGQVFRIMPRFEEDGIDTEDDEVLCIYPIRMYTDYHFLTSPYGKFQSVGFGTLLLHLTDAINTVLNQLLDAGQLANSKFGYKDARLKVIPSTNSYHQQGEFKDVACMPGSSLKDGLFQIQYGEPSGVLFQLLGVLIEHARDISATTDILTGNQNSQNAKTGATMALMQAGRTLHDAIQNRHYQSMALEFQNIFKLNGKYLSKEKNTYAEYDGGAVIVTAQDFDPKKIHIIPVADPNLSSDTERLANAAFVQQMIGLPGIDPEKATRFILEQTTIPGIMDILADPNKSKPDPALIKIQADIEESAQKLNIEGEKLQQNERELSIKERDSASNELLRRAQAIALIAQAEAQNAKVNIEKYKADLSALSDSQDRDIQLQGMMNDNMQQQQDHSHDQNMAMMQQQHEQQMQQSDQQAQQQPEQPPSEQQAPPEGNDNANPSAGSENQG